MSIARQFFLSALVLLDDERFDPMIGCSPLNLNQSQWDPMNAWTRGRRMGGRRNVVRGGGQKLQLPSKIIGAGANGMVVEAAALLHQHFTL